MILFIFLISFWIFVIISQWGNNEVKCAIIKIQNVNAADDYERTLNSGAHLRFSEGKRPNFEMEANAQAAKWKL